MVINNCIRGVSYSNIYSAVNGPDTGISMEILVNKNRVTTYNKDGNVYIEGRKGSEYAIRLKNNAYKPLVAILSVDGLDVISGKPASYKSQGYLLYPGQTWDIEGWRINDNEVRKFIFTRHSQSYSTKTGNNTSNLGVIGLAVFEEKYKPITDSIHYIYDSYNVDKVWASNSIPCTSALNTRRINTSSMVTGSMTSAVMASIGTGMGTTTASPSASTNFDRADTPVYTTQIFYYEKSQLKKLGIIIEQPTITTKPNPFPKEPSFCKEV